MSSKLLALLGLNDSGEEAAESHRKRRTDYMKRIQRLVVPEEGGEEANPELDNIVTAPEADEPAAAEPEATAAESAPAEESAMEFRPAAEEPAEAAPSEDEEEEPEADYEPAPTRSSRRSASQGKSLKSRLFGFGSSLRRPKDDERGLILVRQGASEMIEDLEDALLNGRTLLLDFERVDRETAADVITKMVNYVRTHNGAFYTVTSTSMLLSMSRDAIVEWRPDDGF